MSVLKELADSMMDTIQELKAGNISPEQAQAVAKLGSTVIHAARTEVGFIATVKALDKEGIFNDRVQYLEPNVPRLTKDQEPFGL